MKKNLCLKLALITFISCFLLNWFGEILFDALFILSILLYIPVIILSIVTLRLSVAYLIKDHTDVVSWASIAILILNIVVSLCFPFKEVKVLVELYLLEPARLEVVEMVRNGELPYDEHGNIKLPPLYRVVSSGGEVRGDKEDDGSMIVSFWIFRGIVGNPTTELIYFEKDDGKPPAPFIAIFFLHKKGNVKLKENWYYIISD